jgi:hypothetical protein
VGLALPGPKPAQGLLELLEAHRHTCTVIHLRRPREVDALLAERAEA